VLTLTGSVGKILSMGVSADGQRAVALAEDNTVCEWSLIDGKPLLKVAVESLNLPQYDALHGEIPITAVAETFDGKYIVLGGGNFPVQVRERSTGALVREVVAHGTDSYVSSDGRVMALGAFGTFTMVSMPEGTLMCTLPQGQRNAWQPMASLSTTGEAVLTTNPGAEAMTLYNTATGDAGRTYPANPDGPTLAVLPGDKRRIASQGDLCFGTFAAGGIRTFGLGIILTDVGTGSQTHVSQDGYYDGMPPPMVFSPDGTQLAVGTAHDVAILDVATKRVVARYMEKEGMPPVLAEKIGMLEKEVGEDPRIKDPAFRAELESVDKQARNYFASRRPMVLAFVPDGKRLLEVVDNEILVWDCAANTTATQPGSK
jgi:WD40 repeat protein